MESINIFSFEFFVILLFAIGLIWFILIGQHSFKALLSGIRITPIQVLLMRLRGTPVRLIVKLLIKAHKNGIPIGRDELEACHLGGGNISNIVDGLIYAKAKNIKLEIKEAMKLDLDKRDLIIYLRNK